MREAAICVFAKPPVPGEAKTRLIPSLGAARAAELAEAFLRDTLKVLERFGRAETVVAVTAPFDREYMRNCKVWVQPEGGLDIRLETILRRALVEHPMAFAIGADSPGLPVLCLDQARQQLESHDAVLGPSADGGFYLIGVKQCPPGLLGRIEWSRRTTLQQTVFRMRQQGFSAALISEWFDVDTAEDLSQLESLFAQRMIDCPHTQSVLKEIRQSTLPIGTAK